MYCEKAAHRAIGVVTSRGLYSKVTQRAMLLLALALCASMPIVGNAGPKPGNTGFTGMWKTVKGQEGLKWGEPQLIIIQRRGETYMASGTPGFHTSGAKPLELLLLHPKEGGKTLEYVYVPAGTGIPRYYDLKLSPDKSMLISSHHSKFGVFGGAKYVRFIGKPTSI